MQKHVPEVPPQLSKHHAYWSSAFHRLVMNSIKFLIIRLRINHLKSIGKTYLREASKHNQSSRYHDGTKQQKLLCFLYKWGHPSSKSMLCVFINNNEHGLKKLYIPVLLCTNTMSSLSLIITFNGDIHLHIFVSNQRLLNFIFSKYLQNI